ncbi:putative MFS sugar transporter [Pseudohyphozyma bogoriensis]|nr:putative MFS sugar transporter [Pseudohyphozyma bogoriensis]
MTAPTSPPTISIHIPPTSPPLGSNKSALNSPSLHNFIDTCKEVLITLETDILLSLLTSIASLSLHLFAPEVPFWTHTSSLVSWAFLYLSITTSWSVACRFVDRRQEIREGEGEMEGAREAIGWWVLAGSVIGPPALCASILAFTFPPYNTLLCLLHFALSILPSFLIAIFYTPPPPPTPLTSTTSTSSLTIRFLLPSFLRTPPKNHAIPLRVAVLKGIKADKKDNGGVHPVVKMRMERKKESALRWEVLDKLPSVEERDEVEVVVY